MSPEILLPEKNSSPVSIEDLMRADIWAFGMAFFNLRNPNQRYPYLAEIEKAKGSGRIDDIKVFVSK